MGALNDWDILDANNNAAPPDGWPENTMNYSDVNDTGRAVQGTLKRFFSDINGTLVGAGVADAYTVTLNESGYTSYFNGMIFRCSIPAANTIAAPTIDVNGIGAVTIVDSAGGALVAGQLETGGIYDFQYDGTNFRVGGGLGGALAGGSDTEFQYNSAGVLAGLSTLTTNGSTITFTLGSIGSADAVTFNGSGIGLGALMQLTGDPTTGEVLDISNSGAGNAIRIDSNGLAIEVLDGGISFENVSAQDGMRWEVGSSSYSTITIDGTFDHWLFNNDAFGGGDIRFLQNSDGDAIRFFVDNSGGTQEELLTMINSVVTLRHAANTRLETTAAGMDLTEVVSFLDGFDETSESYTAATGTKNLDVSSSTYFYAAGALTGNTITFTFDNPPASGRVAVITVELNDGGGATAINWPASVDWPGGSAPALSSGIDVISFVTRDGGTIWNGYVGGLDFS